MPDDIAPRIKSIIAKNGELLFTAYGCALTERQAPGGAYVYSAINLNTGKKVELSRRKNRTGFHARRIAAAWWRHNQLFNLRADWFS